MIGFCVEKVPKCGVKSECNKNARGWRQGGRGRSVIPDGWHLDKTPKSNVT